MNSAFRERSATTLFLAVRTRVLIKRKLEWTAHSPPSIRTHAVTAVVQFARHRANDGWSSLRCRRAQRRTENVIFNFAEASAVLLVRDLDWLRSSDRKYLDVEGKRMEMSQLRILMVLLLPQMLHIYSLPRQANGVALRRRSALSPRSIIIAINSSK